MINDLESGLSPRLETVEAIARGFGITVSEIFSGVLPERFIPDATPYLLARQLSRLIEDFVICDAAGRIKVLRAALENSERSGRGLGKDVL